MKWKGSRMKVYETEREKEYRVGAVVSITRACEVAFTKPAALCICAKEVSCLLKKPLVVDAVSWDCRSL